MPLESNCGTSGYSPMCKAYYCPLYHQETDPKPECNHLGELIMRFTDRESKEVILYYQCHRGKL